MKATLALQADRATGNLVRRLAWQLHPAYRTGTSGSLLPPHISLKQHFSIRDLEAVSGFIADWARSIRLFRVELAELQLIPFTFQGFETAILWIGVQERLRLRALHDRLNRELEGLFGNTQADHDGPAYHFHMTVAMGGQPVEVYEWLFRSLPEWRVDRSFPVREVAIFVHEEPPGPQGSFWSTRSVPWGETGGGWKTVFSSLRIRGSCH